MKEQQIFKKTHIVSEKQDACFSSLSCELNLQVLKDSCA